jgi:P-type Ca2+ transporter type 2C
MEVSEAEPLQAESPREEAHLLTAEEMLEQLATPVGKGLSAEEAERRLNIYGHNELDEAPPPTFFQMLWGQLNNFIVWLLLAAAVISAILGDWYEAAAIMAIVVLNAALGVIQERRAEQALSALRRLAAPDAYVLRDGQRQVISSREVVPGDIVLLEAGNYIPADVRLLEAVNLRVEEAPLTGESVPVSKDASVKFEGDVPIGDRKNTAFMGTLVNYGRGSGVVTSTGMKTQIGRIAEMIQAVVQEPTPLQQRLDRLGHVLGYIALAVVGIVFIVGLLRGADLLDMFLLAVTLAIAAVPEGLPAVVTITLALGMREMIKRHALIRRLASVETLGSATVIGSDKTGTLTQNEMTVTRLWVDDQDIEVTGGGYAPYGEFLVDHQPVDLTKYPAALTALWVGALNNDAKLEVAGISDDTETFRIAGDPTEGALVVAAAKAGASSMHLELAYPRVQEIPFDSKRKRMATFHTVLSPRPEDISPFYDDELVEYKVIAEKGAPDVILDLCTHYQRMDDYAVKLDDEDRSRILEANDRMTKDALRVLAVAFRVARDLPAEMNGDRLENELIFVGLIGMIDPPRPEVPEALKKAEHAGIRTIMITGDYPKTAQAIAESIGLMKPGHQVLTGAQIDQMDDADLQEEIAQTDVFARVSPENKVRIVEALRNHDEVVAMTGDGINDAPALKQADIGVAMGLAGTDVAREAADMVLTDDNYASIVAAVEQGRIIYSNIRKFVFYLLSCNVAEIVVIFTSTLAGLASPLAPIQLLWLNLITDGAPALALGTEAGDPDTMTQSPRPKGESIINRDMKIGVVIQTLFIAGVTLGAYWIGLQTFPAPLDEYNALAATMAFITLSTSELIRAFTARSETVSIFRIGVFSNRYMNLAVMSSMVLLLAVIYVPFLQGIFKTVPLDLDHWLIILPLIFLPAVAAELTKLALSRRGRS